MHRDFSVTVSSYNIFRPWGEVADRLLDMITKEKYVRALNSVFCEATTPDYFFLSDSMYRDLQTNHSKLTPSPHYYLARDPTDDYDECVPGL